VSIRLSRQMPNKLPKHIVNLLLLLGIFLLLAFAAKVYLTDPSFYKYGHFRADAVVEIAAGEPLYKGSAYCVECHDEREADWLTGTHVTVQCEVCHGMNRGHPDDGISLIPPDTIRLCTICHEALPARPARQPQIVVAGHPFPDEETEQCHTCHDPHTPGEDGADTAAQNTQIQAEVSTGTIVEQPDAASKCAKCHGKQGQGRRKNPALAGMEVAVFIERMNMYISGERDNKKMTKATKLLSHEEIEELAGYYQSLPAPPPEQ
jgi:cytochrome c553